MIGVLSTIVKLCIIATGCPFCCFQHSWELYSDEIVQTFMFILLSMYFPMCVCTNLHTYVYIYVYCVLCMQARTFLWMLCVCLWMVTCVHKHMCMVARDWGWVSWSMNLILFFESGSFNEPRVYQSQESRACKAMNSFYWMPGRELRSSSFHGNHFIRWAFSTATHI